MNGYKNYKSSGSSRQGYDDLGPRDNTIADRDPAAVSLHDPLHDRHPQTGPLLLGGIERLEDLLFLLRRESRTVVPDSDPHGRLPLPFDLGAMDRDPYGIGTSRQRILQDIPEDLLQGEQIDLVLQVHAAGVLLERDVSPPVQMGQLLPDLAPDLG